MKKEENIKEHVRWFFRLISTPSSIVELRINQAPDRKGGSYKATYSGFFDHKNEDAFLQAVARFNNLEPKAIWVSLNPVCSALLARCVNRVQKADKGSATTAKDITRRRFLFLDIDVDGKAGISATQAEIELASSVADEVRHELAALGFSSPLRVFSGNGFHLHYLVDFPNDKQIDELVKTFMAALAARFNRAGIKIDPAVCDASRMVKLPETWARKGDSTEDRPHRLARFLEEPPPEYFDEARRPNVPRELIEAVIQKWKPPESKKTSSSKSQATGRLFDLRTEEGFVQWIGHHFPDAKIQPHREGGTEAVFEQCPFTGHHDASYKAEAWRKLDGELAFHCMGGTCVGKHWQDLRDLVEPSRGRGSYQHQHESVWDTNEAAPPKQEEPWVSPVPLAKMDVPEAYPFDALPEVIGAAVLEVQGHVKAPMAMVASSALAVVSLASQALFDVERGERLHGPINLFFLIVAESGERKSSVERLFMSALREAVKQKIQGMTAEAIEKKAILEAWQGTREGIKSRIKTCKKPSERAALSQELAEHDRNKPDPFFVPQLEYRDVTPEALIDGLSKVWPSAGIISAEGGAILGGHAMGTDSIVRNLSLFNQLWSDEEVQQDRRTTGRVTVSGARLTVSLQAQESVFKDFLGKSKGLARGSGFLARFLICWPESTQGMRPYEEAPRAWPRLSEFHERIRRLINHDLVLDPKTGGLITRTIKLSTEAKNLWIEHYNMIERLLGRDETLASIRDIGAKAAENTARLAALFEIFEHANQGTEEFFGGWRISEDAMYRAIQIVSWHLSEALRFYGVADAAPDILEAQKLLDWLVKHCQEQKKSEIQVREISRNGPNTLRSKNERDAALATLENALAIRMDGSTGSRRVLLNPELLKGSEQ